MVVARLDLSVVSSILWMSKAAHDSPSSPQSGGIVGAFGSIAVGLASQPLSNSNLWLTGVM